MKIPNKINIAGYDITVKYGKKLFVDNEECFGFYDTKKKQIVLSKGMSPARKREIFLHEFLHAIEDIYRIDITEEGVSCFAIGLSQLFAYNNFEV